MHPINNFVVIRFKCTFAAMQTNDIYYYLWVLFGLSMLWLFIKLAIPKIKEVRAMDSTKAWFTESSITHKVAELFIWIPSYFIILWCLGGHSESALNLLDWTDEWMIFGGVMGFYSFFDARTKYWWAYPFLLICLWGIFGGPLGRFVIEQLS